MSDTDQVKGEGPKYKLTAQAYIDDKLLEPDTVIVYHGVPGWHMEPVNDAARAMKKKHPSKYVDPIIELTDVKATDASVGALTEAIAAALKTALTATPAA